MITASAQISTKYQIVIPKEVREMLAIHPGDRLLFLMDDETVLLRPEPASYTQTLRGLHCDVWTEPAAWLEQERSAWE